MRVLLTNDDGIHAPGLIALYRAIASLGEIHVVAPADIQSASSHAITCHRPIAVRRQRVPIGDGKHFDGIAVEGRPADCVKLAMHKLVPQPVDVVISGMNSGANVGINVIYSGTVAAAMEAGFIGVPAIAVSLHIEDAGRVKWDDAARHARKVIDRLLQGPIAAHTVLNLNVPALDNGEPLGVRVVPVSTSPLVDNYLAQLDHTGTQTYKAGNGVTFQHTPPDSDVDALYQRYITVTPLQFDMTHHPQVDPWSDFLAHGPQKIKS